MPQGSLPLRPILGPVPDKAPRPDAGKIPAPKRWRFSLRFWKQVEYFGVGQCEPTWFVALLERLTDMSSMQIEEFLENRAYKDSVRFHAIDWNAKNIPIAKADINWLGDYSSDEYEFVQFHVSKALGRVVGFFDEDQTFQIVLCDPLHNIQPAGDFGYRVRATTIAECAVTRLALSYEHVIAQSDLLDGDQKAAILASVREVNTGMFAAGILMAISEDHLKKGYELCATKAVSHMGELLELAIDEAHSTYIVTQ